MQLITVEDNRLPDLLSGWDLDPKYCGEFLLCTEGQEIQETYVYEGMLKIFPQLVLRVGVSVQCKWTSVSTFIFFNLHAVFTFSFFLFLQITTWPCWNMSKLSLHKLPTRSAPSPLICSDEKHKPDSACTLAYKSLQLTQRLFAFCTIPSSLIQSPTIHC